MLPFNDTSMQHRTQLETRVRVGRRSQKVIVCIPGRDVWAYQMARIELQNRAALARKQLVAAQPRQVPAVTTSEARPRGGALGRTQQQESPHVS